MVIVTLILYITVFIIVSIVSIRCWQEMTAPVELKPSVIKEDIRPMTEEERVHYRTLDAYEEGIRYMRILEE